MDDSIDWRYLEKSLAVQYNPPVLAFGQLNGKIRAGKEIYGILAP